MSIDSVERQFQEMSRARDAEERSVTEGTGRVVDGGFVRELVSKSPRTGNGPETTTSRTVFTKTDQPEIRRATPLTPTIHRLDSQDVSRPFPRDSSSNGRSTSGAHTPSNTFTNSNTNNNSSGSYTRGQLTKSLMIPSPQLSAGLTSPPPSLPHPRAEPIYTATPPPAPHSVSPTPSSMSSTSTTRSVVFGTTTTRVVEPSRLSPLKVDTNYSPITYMTKREWRKLKKHQGQSDGSLAAKIRCSSVPRLDESVAFNRRPTPQHNAAAPYGQPHHPHGARRQEEVEEDLFHHQEPVPTSMFQGSNDRGIHTNGSNAGSRSSSRGNAVGSSSSHNGGYDQYHADAFYEQNQVQSSRRSPMARGRQQQPRPTHNYAPQQVDMGYVEDEDALDEEEGSEYNAPSSRGSSRGGSVRSVRSNSYLASQQLGHSPASRITQHDDITLQEFGRVLGALRGHEQFPAPPEHGDKAFALLNRGTYLIKYGLHGPHERYVSLRMVHQGQSRLAAPFLVWQTHDQSVSVNERLHLTHLQRVVRGTTSENFSRHMVGQNMIKGPHVGSKKPNLEASCAFTLVFKSHSGIHREVDLLAMDEQTYRCWLMVADYVVSVNMLEGGNGGNGGYREQDVESLAPESASPSTTQAQ